MSYLNPITFEGSDTGPSLLILGAVHGNEPCGHIAIGRILELISRKEINIESGRVTFVQTCNPKALELKQRYAESNLNRRLYPKSEPQTYEDHVGNELCPLLEQADLLLDIHSYRSGGTAFGFISPDQTEEELALLEYCNVPYGVFGFSDAYKASNIPVDDKESMGTREYLLTQGGRGITLECGQHDAPESIEVAYNAILNVLKGFGFIKGTSSVSKTPLSTISMKSVVYKERDGQLTRPFQNFEPIKKDEVLAKYDNGLEVKSPLKGYIVLPDPRPDMPVGEEWLYVGKKVKNN